MIGQYLLAIFIIFFWFNYVDCGYQLGNLPMTTSFVFIWWFGEWVQNLAQEMVTGFMGEVMGLTVCLEVTVATEGDRSMSDRLILS